jgi:hypothetical protein
LRKALAAGLAFAFVASLAGAADARASKRTQTVGKREAPNKQPFGELPKGPLQMVVSIGHQHVTLYANGIRVAQSRVSTGTASHPTPTGVFSVIEKDRWHRSNLYGSAPMFYMQRLTWSGVAMHEGILPGYAASHGCIRMPSDFASRLWVTTRLGVRIVVARNDPAPYEFEHPSLFNPAQKPLTAQIAELPPTQGLRPTVAASEAATGSRIKLAQAAVNGDAGPIASAADQPPTPVLPAHPREDDPAVAQSIEAAPPPAASPIEIESTASTPAPAEPKAMDASSPVVPEAPALGVAAAAAEAPATSEPEKREPVGAEPNKPAPPRNRAGEPLKPAGQVAVFVSKREKKIFVRQGFIPLFDMPVEIADPDQPLGTHVFTAMEIQDGGTRMRWNAISMPPETPRGTDGKGKRKASKKSEPPPPAVVKAPSTASEALDRIKIPQEAIDRISELLIPGSSLVVSDNGLGPETGRYTEFIVLTR